MLVSLTGMKFTQYVDFMVMLPLAPAIVSVFNISDAQFGWLVTVYTAGSALSVLLASIYIDRFDRKRLLLTLYAAFGCACLLTAMASSYASLLAARMASGAFAGVLSSLMHTIVGEVVPFERRGKASGVLMTSLSLSTSMGVPAGLFAAHLLGWNASFLLIGCLCLGFGVAAWLTVPSLTIHFQKEAKGDSLANIWHVLCEPNHWRAYAFSVALLFGSFPVMPYITLYLQSNVGLTQAEIPVIYVCTGMVTIFTVRLFGSVADKLGPRTLFAFLGSVIVIPLMLLTTLPRTAAFVGGLAAVMLLFTCNSGRMVPAMTMLISTPKAAMRGPFMTLNSAMQSLAMGAAAAAGGLVLSRDASGLIENYWLAGLLASVSGLVAIGLSRRISLGDG